MTSRTSARAHHAASPIRRQRIVIPVAAAFLSLLAAPAAGQVTLVSNTGQVDGQVGTLTLDHAQAFTTGSNSGGYTVTGIDIQLGSVGQPTRSYEVEFYTDVGGRPDASIGLLSGPATLTANSVNSWTTTPGIDLAASTTYFIFIRGSSGSNRLQNTHSNFEDAGGLSGWSIADQSFFEESLASLWTQFAESKKIAVKGYEKGLTPGQPAAPAASPVPNSDTSLNVNWAAPTNTGPPIQSYDLRYREGTSGTWTDGPQEVTGTNAIITGLTSDTLYEVQLRGTNSAGDGPWSLSRAATPRLVSVASRSSTPRNPQPLQLALWTDWGKYRVGETVRLYRTVRPHDDRGSYRTFVYLEQVGRDERQYLAPLASPGDLHPDPVDVRGMPESAARARTLDAADRALAWEGEAPEPVLWRFLMELRPDLTLHSDTIYYLGHQLFVHDGATLTIKSGTVVRAFGRHTAIIVERGGRIVAEGTREAPIVLGCSLPAGHRQPGCWGGLRILGKAPVTRLEGAAPGVLPAARPLFGGTDAENSSGSLRYVRVECAGAAGDEETAGPGIGLYGTGSGTVLDHVQVHASLGDGFAFDGGTAVCGHCVASGARNAGLSWERGWRGGASHLYVQHGSDAVAAAPSADLLFADGHSAIAGSLFYLNGSGRGQLRGLGLRDAVEFTDRDPKLRDARDFANPDPRPKAGSPALTGEGAEGYTGAFDRTENWLEEWAVFGPESLYDLRERSDDEN